MNFFLFLNGQQAGPYTEDQLRQFLAAGQVQGSDFAWREGLADWAPIATLLAPEATPPGAVPVSAPVAEPAPAAAVFIPDGKLRKEPVVPKQIVRKEEPEEEPESAIKTWMWIVGGIVVAGILCVAAAVAFLFWQGGQMDASSKAYVDTYVSSIAPNWSADDFIAHVAPQFREKYGRDKVEALFSRLSTLGNLRKYDGSTGEAHISIRSLGQTVSARYAAHATFDEGEATFEIALLRVDGQWTIVGISVKSPILR
jgi:hypothetical protein